MRDSRSLAVFSVLTLVTVGVVAWLVTSVKDLHDRLAAVSPWLAVAVISVIVVSAAVCGLASARLFWKLGRPDAPGNVKAPADVVKAAEVQVEKAEKVLEKIQDAETKAKLAADLETIRDDGRSRRFHVVVFGTGSAGKTSLINALLGQEVGKTEAVIGTTRKGEKHDFRIEGDEGEVILTDTPGLSEVGEGGALREAEARDLAARADLLLFVVDHDLIRSEYEPLLALARQGKRAIVALNKKDRFLDEDRDAILSKLRERLRGIVEPDDVVPISASPRPIPIRITREDGTVETAEEKEPADLVDLENRIERILKKEGDSLRAGNLLLRAHLVAKAARDRLSTERDRKADEVINRFQWITAGTVFANPLPAFDLMATGAVQFQMVSEIAAAYDVEMTMSHARMIGGQMIQMLLKLGMVEAATSLTAGLLKSTLIGFAAGGLAQATSMAYLTHVSGSAFKEYFRQGQTWGDGGMQAALIKQFDLNSRGEFLQEFAKQAIERFKARFHKEAEHSA